MADRYYEKACEYLEQPDDEEESLPLPKGQITPEAFSWSRYAASRMLQFEVALTPEKIDLSMSEDDGEELQGAAAGSTGTFLRMDSAFESMSCAL